MRYLISLILIFFYSSISEAKSIGTEEVAFTIPNTNRELVAEIYFPANEKTEPIIIDYGVWQRKAFLKNAPIPLRKYPLVVFSHGWQGDRFGNLWIAESLVDNGYIVAMVDHTHNTSYDHNDLFIYSSMWQRPLDMSALITYLIEHPQWQKAIDQNRIAAGGFSLGGLTALWLGGIEADEKKFKKVMDSKYSRWDDWPKLAKYKAAKVDWSKATISYYDKRIKTVFSIAPDLGEAFQKEGIKQIKVPTLLIVGDKDKVTPAEKNAYFYHSNIPNSEFFLIRHAEHFSFLNNCSNLGKNIATNLCYDAGNTRTQIHNETAAKIIKFLTINLSN